MNPIYNWRILKSVHYTSEIESKCELDSQIPNYE